MLDIASPPASRLRQPRWLDTRLLAGVGLVLLSIVLGARVIAAATDSDLVWQVRAELAAGAPLDEQDVRAVEVRLTGAAAGSYLDATAAKPVGWVLTRPIGPNELLPRNALAPPDVAATHWRIVTVPVARFHYPGDLAKGQQVDVYLSVDSGPLGTAAGGGAAAPELVLHQATVARVDGSTTGLGSGGSGIGVELAVPVDDAAALVRAAQAGAIDLVRVPSPWTEPR
ncbi:MAG: SAF domain-containing protein [Sporichthyaceae bacterium]|nr:SAF domain-containing protein [Sporichthyaceae bacterium]